MLTFPFLGSVLELTRSGWARHEANVGFQPQSPRLPIASRIPVASLLVSHQADHLSGTASRGCVVFHMRWAVWQMEPRGCPGPFNSTRLEFVLLPKFRCGSSINQSTIPLFNKVHVAHFGRALRISHSRLIAFVAWTTSRLTGSVRAMRRYNRVCIARVLSSSPAAPLPVEFRRELDLPCDVC